MATLVRPGAPEEERRSAGLPLPGIDVRIVDPAGAPVSPGQGGSIEIRGTVVMQGYVGDAGATRMALRDGWLRTNDLGRIEDGGLLHVLCRGDAVILSGGERIDPAEIERALGEHPGVAEAVVVAVPDARWGERPLAAVVARAKPISVEELERHLRARLAGYKMPRLLILESIPRLASGKPDRRALRALYPPAPFGI